MGIKTNIYCYKENYVKEELADARRYFQKMSKAIKMNNAKGFIVSVEDLKNGEHKLFKAFFDHYKRIKLTQIEFDFKEFVKTSKSYTNFFDFVRHGKYQKTLTTD